MALFISLDQALSTPSGKSRYVRRLFSRIADRYDLITVVLSYGLDKGWKRRLIASVGRLAGARMLDLATGTGDIAFLGSTYGASVVGLDVASPMLKLAAQKNTGRAVQWIQGDMAALPFLDHSFDVITTGYGLRNVPELSQALDEIARVLRPGGQFLSLEFDRPPNRLVRSVYLTYLTITGSLLGWLLHADPDTYRYIAASLRRYPGSTAVSGMLRERGFHQTEVMPVLCGLLAIHRARKM